VSPKPSRWKVGLASAIARARAVVIRLAALSSSGCFTRSGRSLSHQLHSGVTSPRSACTNSRAISGDYICTVMSCMNDPFQFSPIVPRVEGLRHTCTHEEVNRHVETVEKHQRAHAQPLPGCCVF